MMTLAAIWAVVLYLMLVRGRGLKCPHCGGDGVSASKKLVLGPVFRSKCSICSGRWRTSNWSVVLAICTGLCIGAAVIADMAEIDLPFMPIPEWLVIPLLLTMDFLFRLYVLPTIKSGVVSKPSR